jgi:hypothetical protein
MRLHDALEQLDAIHEHLDRAEVYRGFRVHSVAVVGGLGFVAAAIQPAFDDSEFFVMYWLAVAGIAALVGFGAAGHSYFFRDDEFARRKTRQVTAQFAPSLAAGAIITAALSRGGWDTVSLLPGLWAVAFGLGLVAARPFLPRGIGSVGLGYIVAGGMLLTRMFASPERIGWSVGLVFGFGHFITAVVLHLDRPREHHG